MTGSEARRPSFGRDEQRLALGERLTHPGVVGLSGPPGIGKTHLAREVADAWEGEVHWVDLNGMSSSDEVVAAASTGLRLTGSAKTATIGHALRSRPGALLVLDHGEGAVAALEPLLGSWRTDAPTLTVLVCSRIRVGGADPWPLAPLTPEAATALYRSRAGAMMDAESIDADAVTALVTALDCLPFAIELAAARVRLFPPKILLQRLPGGLADSTRTDRHRSLEAALQASWELLTDTQRGGLAAASVLRGPFDAAGFEAVTGSGAEVLEALLDASLVTLARPGQVRLLETVRAFAERHLAGEERTAVEARHAAHVLALAEAATDKALREGDWDAVEDMRADLQQLVLRGGRERIRAALVLGEVALRRWTPTEPTRTIRDDEIPEDLKVRLAWIRTPFLLDEGLFDQALAGLDALPTPRNATEHLMVARHRMAVMRHLNRPEDVEAARVMGAKHAADADAVVVAEFRIQEAVCRLWCGAFDDAIDVLRALHPITAGAPALEAERLALLGGVEVRRMHTANQGATHLEHALVLCRQRGLESLEGSALLYLGMAYHEEGRLDRAAECLWPAAMLAARAGSPAAEGIRLLAVSQIRIEQRDWDEVSALHARFRALPPIPRLLSVLAAQEGYIAHLDGRLDDAVVHYQSAMVGSKAHGSKGPNILYRVLLALADPARGPGLLDEAETIAADVGMHLPLLVKAAREMLVDGLTEPTAALLRSTQRTDVRLLLALADPPSAVSADGSWFSPGGSDRVDLDKRPVLRRALAALVAAGPGNLVARQDLIDAVWPGQKMVGASADARLHSTVRALRRLGLEEVLRTGDVGGELAYGLDASVAIR